MTAIEPKFSPFPVEMDVEVFRLCIAKWANQFKVKGDPDGLHASFLYAIGHNINMKTGSWRMSWFQISQAMVKHRKKIGRYTSAPSRATIDRYMAWAKVHGVIVTERTPFRYDSGKVLPGANQIWINVNRVVVWGEVLEWDFFSPLIPENSDQQTEETLPPAPSSPPTLTLVGKDEASMRHRRGIDETSDEASMRHNTVLDTGGTVLGTVLETVRGRCAASGAEPPDPREVKTTANKTTANKSTANKSTANILRTWGMWHKVSIGSIGEDIGTSVSPGQLKATLDGYLKEFERAYYFRNINDFLRGEAGLRARLDKDLGLNLVYTAQLHEIERKERSLAELGTSHGRYKSWTEEVANFRRQHPAEAAV